MSDPNEPRRPKNVKDLLKYAIDSKPAGIEHAEPFVPRPLSPERQQFLETVIKSITVDVAKELKDAIDILITIDKFDEDPNRYFNAFDIIHNRVDDLDAANDFVKLGGFNVLHDCLKFKNSEIRLRAADLLAICSQNNPFCQRQALEHNFLPTIFNILENEPDENVRIKAFYAVASIVRDSSEALKAFVESGGLDIIILQMMSGIQKLVLKSVFLLSSLIVQDNSLIPILIEKNVVKELIDLLNKPEKHNAVFEHVLSTLEFLIKNNEKAKQDCSKSDVLKQLLKRMKEDFGQSDQYETELETVNNITKLINL